VEAGVTHISKISDARGGKFSPRKLFQTYNVTLGEHVGATPDGRKAFTALSDNASPYMGRDTNGLPQPPIPLRI
jgi:formate C-acetyltransferase